ncbi:MAG TPA: hypothetical protein PLR44_11510 [Thermomicrobiales bacterium]|nr:hypothetical protein [Chloroflexota bacterium]HBY46466.1 hypothetical protein [Chloroflexota bacterium]HCG30116.1 hypothetical protein [Chloroflexota bacterium]HQZ90668.1 hypothetical protein [Thermomicrobiales bacterium]HRA31245.1 hypothetical protein [Thermomicrobiales bacterium]
MEPTPEKIQLDWVMLADAAQIVNGKLYVLGGGWDTLVVSSPFPVNQPCGLAIAFRIPGAGTNPRKTARIQVVDQEGTSTIATADVQFQVGRPPEVDDVLPQRVQLAAGLHLSFPKAGTYVVIVSVDNAEIGRSRFRVVHPQPAGSGERLNA